MVEEQVVIWNYYGKEIELEHVYEELEVKQGKERFGQLEGVDEELSGSDVH